MAIKERALNSAQAKRKAHAVVAELIDDVLENGSDILDSALDGLKDEAADKVREALTDLIAANKHKSV